MMYTQCPYCTTLFRIRPDQLKVAGGKVRCSRCRTVFDALDQLRETEPEDTLEIETEHEEFKPELSRTGWHDAIDEDIPEDSIIDYEQQLSAETQLDSTDISSFDHSDLEADESFLTNDILISEEDEQPPELPSDFDTDLDSLLQQETTTSEPLADSPLNDDFLEAIDSDTELSGRETYLQHAQEHNDDNDESFVIIDEDRNEFVDDDSDFEVVDHDSEPADEMVVDPVPAAKNESGAQDASIHLFPGTEQATNAGPDETEPGEPEVVDGTPQRELSFDMPENVPPLLPTEAPPETPQQKPASKGKNVLWATGILLLLFLLTAQLIWSQRQLLMQYPQANRWLRSACAQLGCELPVYRDIEKLRVLSRQVTPAEGNSSELVFTATIINSSEFAQPFPDIELLLLSKKNQPIGQRLFQPREYLNKPADQIKLFEPNHVITVKLHLVEPDTPTEGFKFEFY